MLPVRSVGEYDVFIVAESSHPDIKGDVTLALDSIKAGETGAAERLLGLLYQDLRAVAGRQFRGQNRNLTLQPTDLVHDAFLRLVGSDTDWKSRAHFLAAAATAMRRLIVDHARARRAEKRGSGERPLDIDELAVAFEERSVDLVRLDDALTRLAEFDPMKSRLVELRFFTGMTVPDAAEILGMSRATAERAWTIARAWLQREVLRG